MKAAKVAQPISGEKLYQERARSALPLLVRQAKAGIPIFYSDLASELGMPNPRNLDYVLGSIGHSMENLSKLWKEKVPPIQCLVINKNTGLPGSGVGWFLIKKEDFAALPLQKRRSIVKVELQKIFAYSRWDQVLEVLSLAPVSNDFSPVVSTAAHNNSYGESERHLALKEFLASNPKILGLPGSTPKGEMELALPSGDSLDVSFKCRKDWIAAEVKSALSNEADITRGLFQCVKYRAVMEAVQAASALPQNSRAILVLENTLPPALLPLKNVLGVEVVEGIIPKK